MKYVEVMTYLKDNGKKVCRYVMSKTRATNWQSKLSKDNYLNIVALISDEYKTREDAEIGGFPFPDYHKVA